MPRIECCNRRIETCPHESLDAPGSAGRDFDDGFVVPLGSTPFGDAKKTEPFGDACLRPLRVGFDDAGDSCERCHAPDLVTEERPDDGRSIRPPGTPLTYPRRKTCSARGAGSPLFTLFACWTERVRRGTLRDVRPTREGRSH
jgi:hypothetical protein